MKMKVAQKVHYDAGPNMTPLVDVVMVILIFLMLTGSFAVGEHFLQSNLPLSQKGIGEAPKESVPQDEPLEIRVDSTGEDQWAAQAGGFLVRNNMSQLEDQLKRMHKAFRDSGRTTDKIQVQINPGRGTKYKHLVEIYQAALGAEFSKIGFTTAH